MKCEETCIQNSGFLLQKANMNLDACLFHTPYAFAIYLGKGVTLGDINLFNTPGYQQVAAGRSFAEMRTRLQVNKNRGAAKLFFVLHRIDGIHLGMRTSKNLMVSFTNN